MRALHRKLIRDLLGSASSLAVVIAIISIGTGSYLGLSSAQRILEASQVAYYHDYRFADFWIDLKKAPLSAVERITKLPGVARLESRVTFDVILDLPEETRPITGRLISTPKSGFDRALNGLCLIRGSGFSDNRDEEVIVSDPFAEAHHLQVGDRIEIILNRKRQTFTIIGTAISPEYVYMVRGPGDLVPDPEHFGILYIKDRYARDILDFKDSCNQLVGTVIHDAESDIDLLLDRMERVLNSFGVLETIPRYRQASHRFLSDEIAGLRITATIMPAIFLGVAALVMNILMTRLAQRQRTTIGTLKALGYSDQQVMSHYLFFGLSVGVVGGVAGVLLGLSLAFGMIEIYKGFFQFPRFVFRIHADLVTVSVMLSIAFSVLGTARGVWEVLRLRPAEAMRQKPPERGGKIFLERFPRLWRAIGFRTQMALRNVFRNRVRTLTSIVASTLAVSIIFLSLVMWDSFVHLVEYQFEKVVHSDVDIGLRSEKSTLAAFEARELPGVDYSEPVLGLICELRHGRHSRRMGVTGLSPDHKLTTPMQADGHPIRIPRKGLVLSRKLAELLDAREGSSIAVTPARGRRRTVRARVAAIVDSFLGMDCYADQRYLSELVGESLAVNSVQLSVNRSKLPALYEKIKNTPDVQNLVVSSDARRNIEETLVETSVFSIGLMIVFAGVIAFGSTLNNALFEIGDRVREISTLRALGYRPGEVAGILLRQSLITFSASLVIAFPVGYWMVHAISTAYDSELYRIPVVVHPTAVVSTILLAVGFVMIAHSIAYRQIKKLDWIEGVQVKE